MATAMLFLPCLIDQIFANATAFSNISSFDNPVLGILSPQIKTNKVSLIILTLLVLVKQERIYLREILARADKSKTLPISLRRSFHTQCVF